MTEDGPSRARREGEILDRWRGSANQLSNTYGTMLLIGETGKAVKAEFLNVIHHPDGDPKRISIRDNQMVAQDDLWLRYRSDAERGSSGAPVFNDQWEVVALDHGGVPIRDTTGADLALDGRRWTPEMGIDAKAYTANEGARVSKLEVENADKPHSIVRYLGHAAVAEVIDRVVRAT